jgi:hypothetical protein
MEDRDEIEKLKNRWHGEDADEKKKSRWQPQACLSTLRQNPAPITKHRA